MWPGSDVCGRPSAGADGLIAGDNRKLVTPVFMLNVISLMS
jgi:hypothetical protein